MKLNALPRWIVLTPSLSLVLLLGCATRLPLPSSSSVPPLPQSARQPPPPAECLPTCSERLRIDYERWRTLLTSGARPAPPAKPATTR